MTRKQLIEKFQASREMPETSLKRLGSDAETVIGSLMDAALTEFSIDAPCVETQAGTFAGTDIALTYWFQGASVRSIECPTGQRPKVYLAPKDYEGDAAAGTVYLLTATSGSTAYSVKYNALHRLPDPKEADANATAAITIPTEQHQAFFRLVVAYACERLAALHGETVAGAFAADAVSYQTKSGEYLRLAKDARIQYRRLLGLPDEPTVMPFTTHVEYDTSAERIFTENTSWPASS